jgi:putative two-component system response regulator
VNTTPAADTVKTLLAVDDTPSILRMVTGVLSPAFKVRVATSGAQALTLVRQPPVPDLILLDVMMQGMDGYEVCRQLKADPLTAAIPVIFLTARTDAEDETRGFELGAADYVAKPINPAVLQARVRAHLAQKAWRDFLENQNDVLERQVCERTAQVQKVQDATILAMASLAETRDNETGHHILRTQRYVEVLAQHLRDHPRFSAELSEGSIQLMVKSAPLHDIGKVGIPDHILLKPGPLDAQEFEIMKTHTTLGREAIESAEQSIGRPVPFLRFAKEIALSHQEKWDGSGYPEGLKGDAIPLSARLMALADVYDALISRRVYKPAFSHEASVKIILESGGRHFDPAVVAAFDAVREDFRSIAARYADEETAACA